MKIAFVGKGGSGKTTLSALEPGHHDVLRALRHAVDSRKQDWTRFQAQAVEFHLRNARAWANNATGVDLAVQVDPEFVHGPHALSAVSV